MEDQSKDINIQDAISNNDVYGNNPARKKKEIMFKILITFSIAFVIIPLVLFAYSSMRLRRDSTNKALIDKEEQQTRNHQIYTKHNTQDIQKPVNQTDTNDDYYVFAIRTKGNMQSEFSILKLNKDGSTKNELYRSSEDFYQNFSPILSPDRTHIVVEDAGIIDLNNKTVVKTLDRNERKLCQWFSDNTKLGCYGHIKLENDRIDYRISVLDSNGIQKILKRAIVTYNYNPDKDTVSSEDYYSMGAIIGIRNDKELIISSEKGFTKLNTETNEFTDILARDKLGISTPAAGGLAEGVVYSQVLDKIIYLGKFDRQDKYGLAGTERYLNKLVSVDIQSGNTTEIWNRIGILDPEHLFLSKDQKKVVFETVKDYYSSYNKDIYRIVDLIDNNLTEIEYENGGESTNLLGFTSDDRGVILSESFNKKTSIKDSEEGKYEFGPSIIILYKDREPKFLIRNLLENSCKEKISKNQFPKECQPETYIILK